MSFGYGFSLPALRQAAAGSSNLLGPTLDLIFVDMDTSYTTGNALDLDFTSPSYQVWQAPTNPQGTYYVWEGYAPWDPYLNLDFVNQLYQVVV